MRNKRAWRRNLVLFVIGALLGGCAGSDRAAYILLTGEAPGEKAAYVDIAGLGRIGRSPPSAANAFYRPANMPIGRASRASKGKPTTRPVTRKVVQLLTAYGQWRLSASARDDEVQFNRRSLRLRKTQYVNAVKPLVLKPGDSLPAFDANFKARLKAARDGLDGINADVLRQSGVLALAERDRTTGRALLTAATALSKARGAAADRKLAAEIGDALTASLKTLGRLDKDLRREMGALLEYVSQQQSGLGKFEQQVAAGGALPPKPWRPRVPESWEQLFKG